MSFKENLRNEFIYQDISVKEFAYKLGIPYGTIRGYLGNTEYLPNIETGYKIAKGLNISMEYLLTGTEGAIKIKNDIYHTIIELQQLPEEQIKIIKNIVWSFSKINKTKG